MNLDQFKKNNRFLMLAFDHRGSFKKLMNHEDPDSVTDEQAIALKKEIIDSLRGQFSSVLIDQTIGLHAYEPKDKPFLLPVEKSGYEQQGKDRLTELAYSIEDLKAAGASGAKILVYFNPFGKTAQQQLETSKKVLEDCKKNDFPYFLEIRNYNDQGEESDKMEAEEREKIGIASLKMFMEAEIYPDVYKLEYPGSGMGCQTISAILQEKQIPWIMLTMGAGFDEFAEQLKIASERGCQGFLAGRAVWADVCTMHGEEKEKFLKEILPGRFRKICTIMEDN
jgi:tagatose-1,6-bisphosphate aldolase